MQAGKQKQAAAIYHPITRTLDLYLLYDVTAKLHFSDPFSWLRALIALEADVLDRGVAGIAVLYFL